MRKIYLSLLVIFSSVSVSISQNIGVNSTGSAPAASAGLDVDFTNKGVLVPRIGLTSTTDVTTISSPATSLLVYNTATAGVYPTNVVPCFYYFDGTKWVKFQASNVNDWSLIGNSGTSSTTNFLGTTDDVDLVFKRNNVQSGWIGSSNTSFGVLGMNPNNILGGTFNSSFGYNALKNNSSGSANVAVGNSTLAFNTLGNNNVALGNESMYSNIDGNYNVGCGAASLRSNTSGFYNTSIGDHAMFGNISGAQNTAIGATSLDANTVGNENVAVGYAALGSNTTGMRNTAIGFSSLSPSMFNSTSWNNVAVGYTSLQNNSSGNNNVALGAESLKNSTSAASNVCIGYRAGNTLLTGSSNIAIGTNVNVLNPAGSNQLNIGNWLYGDNGKIGVGVVSPAVSLEVAGTDAIKMPSGTTAQRPASPLGGYLRYNTDVNMMEYYNGTTWVQF